MSSHACCCCPPHIELPGITVYCAWHIMIRNSCRNIHSYLLKTLQSMAGILASINTPAYASVCSGAGELISGAYMYISSRIGHEIDSIHSCPDMLQHRLSCVLRTNKLKIICSLTRQHSDRPQLGGHADLHGLLQFMATPGAFAPDSTAKVQWFVGTPMQSKQGAQQSDRQVPILPRQLV